MFNRYYQDELTYLRDLGREFAAAYPGIAPMLAERGGDPDVERLLEGVAFLTGKIRQKLDDELPEVIHSVASLLFPHYLRQIPATSIIEFTPLPNVVREKLVDRRIGSGNAQASGAGRPTLRGRAEQPVDLDSVTPEGLDVHGPDEPGADDRRTDLAWFSHGISLAAGRFRTSILEGPIGAPGPVPTALAR